LKVNRFFTKISGQILLTVIALISIGLLNLYSVTCPFGVKVILFKKQLFWVGLGFLTLLAVNLIGHRKFYIYAYHLYAITIFLLFALLFFAPALLGTRRWFALGPISFQPSEITKLVLIIILARYISETKLVSQNLNTFLKAFLLTAIPIALITLEPDLGTALLLLIFFGTILVLSKVNNKIIFATILIGLFLLPFIWQFGLKDYQRARISGFLFPQKDCLGIGYHILQAKIAIGSGGLLGKGFLKGTQTKLRFLPEHYTDFIFSGFAEQWGFIGCSVLLMLYLFLILGGIKIVQHANHPFSFLLASGIIAMFFWQILINIAMNLGLLPVVGVPLPFMSYGGSAMLTNFMAIGLLINVGIKGK
jgi:rod shape determining protein RodA